MFLALWCDSSVTVHRSNDSTKFCGSISDKAALVMRMNTPFEQHASVVYTRAMFWTFGEILYEGGQYRVEEVEKGVKYLVHRYHPEKHDKWCRAVYAVAVMDQGAEVACECVVILNIWDSCAVAC